MFSDIVPRYETRATIDDARIRETIHLVASSSVLHDPFFSSSNIDYVPISSICSHPLLPPHPRLLSLPLPLLLLLLALSPSLPLPPSLRFPVARFRFWQLSSPRFKIGIVDRSRVKSPSLPRNVTFDSFRTGLTRPVLSKERETRAGRRVWAQKIHLKMPEGRAKVSK